MQALTDTLLPIVNTINGYLSDYILVFLLMGAGLYFSFKTKFVQVRCFGEGMKRVFGNLTLSGKKHESGMSSFQALATAIAAQVGTGNIVGASGAILTGGPGAIFWMWIIAFFGMATIYAEAVLAQKTRVKNEDGQYLGGPVYYIRTAFQGSLLRHCHHPGSGLYRLYGTVQLHRLYFQHSLWCSVLDRWYHFRYLPCYYLWIYLHGRCRSSCFRY